MVPDRDAVVTASKKRIRASTLVTRWPPTSCVGRTTPRSQKEVLESLAVAESAILLMDQQLDKLPAEINFDEAHAGEKMLGLNYEKKRFLDCIKVFGCNLKPRCVGSC